MQRLMCGQSLKLQLPDCATAPTAAVLQRAGFADITLSLAFDNDTNEVTLTPVSEPSRGVWQLRVVTACGCYYAHLAVDTCKPVGFLSAHIASRQNGIVTVCCSPDEGEDIVFDSFTLSAGDIVDGIVTLTHPLAVDSVPVLWIVGGLIQQFTIDYNVSGNNLIWAGMGLEELLEEGDIIQIHYQRAA